MRQPRSALRLTSLATASGLLFAGAAVQAQATAPAASNQLETVIVTGIRQSLESSVNLKRNASGLVDGIVAEDIGKFPDTNLAESLSRISGVSIDRNNGEGTKVTVRGMGPDYNLVLLNGRQMPGSNVEGNAPTSRSFDFSNLASEGVAALEVYKTSRASSPTGGMGATINIRTPRPFDTKQTIANFGVKFVKDESTQRLPDPEKGKTVTPEVSGIYSSQFADGKFGIALIGSYQQRDSGYNQAYSNNGWKSFPGIKDNNWSGPNVVYGGLPATSPEIKNRPAVDSIYSVPQSFAYAFTGIHRERKNGQLVLQAKPMQDLVATLDYTMSEQKFRQTRNDISAWFGFNGQFGEFEKGPIASPIVYGEHTNGSADLAMGASRIKTKNQNKSLGLNLNWKPTNALSFSLDGHHSTATSGADDPMGTSVSLGTASMNRGDTSVNYSQKFPVLTIAGTSVDPALMELQGSVFSNSYQRNQVDQWQAKGNWKFDDDSGLDFGVSLTNVKNRSAYTVVQRNVWGGGSSGGVSAMPDNIWHVDSISKYFSRVPGSNSPALFNQFMYANFDDLRNAAIKTMGSSLPYLASFDFDNSQGYGAKLAADPNNITYSTQNFRTAEKSQALFLQYNRSWELGGMPFDAAVGGRYERTTVDSPSTEQLPTAVVWNGKNEFGLSYSPTSTASGGTGKYNYFLPSIDLSADVTTNTKLRVSYGSTIGRPGWADIQGGRTTDVIARVDGASGKMGNPALKPLKSNNLDLSAEHYYAKGSYIAASFFRKSITNYIESKVVPLTPFNLHTPAMGALFNEAVAAGCKVSELDCIGTYIFKNHPTAPGVKITGTDTAGNPIGTITGQPSDPTIVFDMTTPLNNSTKKSLSGIELNFQHTFSNGFGASINFTRVRSGLKYKNGTVGDQTGTALVGTGDSGNIVGFYENESFSGRVAYNWRGKYLSNNYSGSEGAQPLYTEAYGQMDVALGYSVNKNLSLQFEVINLTDRYTRTSMRDELQVGGVTQLGRRMMFGARYKF